MCWKIFITQWEFPFTRGEWAEQVRGDLEMFGICDELNWIKSKSRLTFKALVKKQARELALVTLMNKKEKHSKMDDLMYVELSMQNYLKDEKIRVQEARILFKFRTRMAKFWGNFKGGRPPQQCPVCKEPGSVDTQLHSFQCKVLAENINMEGNYSEMFTTNIDKNIARKLENIEKFREELLENEK